MCQVVSLLLAAGGDPDAPAGELGDTPLMMAVRNRQPALVCTVPGSTWKYLEVRA